MFATLVIVLPSVYAGGELLIRRHREREVCLPLACPDPSDAAFVAFYADCVHEVRPVTSGTRLTLIYNLIRDGETVPASPPQYRREQVALAAMLSGCAAALDAGAGAGNLPKNWSIRWNTRIRLPSSVSTASRTPMPRRRRCCRRQPHWPAATSTWPR